MHAASEQLATLSGFDGDEALNVGLAVREAVINAMLHGNQQDPKLKVTVILATDSRNLTAKVIDQGSGFDPHQAPDPTDKQNRLRHTGRGLLLMEAFVDKVDFRALQSGGMQVTMTKKLPKKKDDNDE